MLGLVAEHLLVERKPLMVQRVAEPVALGAQVRLVVGVWDVLDRDLIGHRQAVAGEAEIFFGLLVMIRMLVRPRSTRIWAPMP